MIYSIIYFLKLRHGLFLAALIPLFCLGCALTTKGKGRESLFSNKKILTNLFERRDSLRDVRGRGLVTIFREEKKQTFAANLLFDSLYRLRMEGLGFMNMPSFFLVADEEEIKFYIPEEQKIICGDLSERNLFKLTGLKINVKTLITLLSGNLPPDISRRGLQILSGRDQKNLVELWVEQKNRYRLWIDPYQGIMAKIEGYDADKRLVLSASFDHYERRDGYLWPGIVECSFISSGVRLRIKYKQVFLNQGVTRAAFILEYPKNTMIEDLDQEYDQGY